MSRKRPRVQYELDTGDIKELPMRDIRMILRGADELIDSGGRTMLAKILKGSKDKKVLELNLQECPAYGYYSARTLKEILNCIDFCIVKDYLRIRYNGRLPMLIFSPKGWEIEKQTYAKEWYCKLKMMALTKKIDMEQIKELLSVNRQVIVLMIDIAKADHYLELEPVLISWKEIEVKKVRAMIDDVIVSYMPGSDITNESQGVAR